MGPAPPPLPWARSPIRRELLALYAEADSLLEGWACACSRAARDRDGDVPRCCHFAVTGREPYPTAVELEEVRYAVSSGLSDLRAPRRKLPVAGLAGACPLLSADGQCRVYRSRPFGCRTFFCVDAEGPAGPRSKPPRDAVQVVGRRIADLSSRFAPRDPHARPLVRALEALVRRRRG